MQFQSQGQKTHAMAFENINSDTGNSTQPTPATVIQSSVLTQQRLVQGADNRFYRCPILNLSSAEKCRQTIVTASQGTQTSEAQTKVDGYKLT